MLVPVMAMPVVFGMLDQVPEGSPEHVTPLTAMVTVLAIVVIALKSGGAMRLWAPVIGVVLDSAVGGLFGLYDFGRVADARWVEIPSVAWLGIDLGFGPAFWSLIPAFLLVTLIVTLRSISSCVAAETSGEFSRGAGCGERRRGQQPIIRPRGTIPNTGYSVSSPLAQLTGVAARSVGIATGSIFLVLAFFPKEFALSWRSPGRS